MSLSLLCENGLNLKQNKVGLKCGEIYFNQNDQNKVTLSCVCKQLFFSLEIFTKHLLNEHFIDNSISKINLENNLKNEQDISKKNFDFEIAENRVKDYSFENLTSSEELKNDDEEIAKIKDEEIGEKDLDEEIEVNSKEDLKSKITKQKEIANLKKIKIPNGYFKCALCSEILKKDEKVDHLNSHKDTKRFICETSSEDLRIIGDEEITEKDLDKEIEVNSKEDLKSKISKQKEIANPKKKKIPNGYFKCPLCAEILMKDEKVDHLKSHNTKRFICETCGKGYKERNQLIQHMRNHTGERPFKCQFCLAAFKLKDTLRRHERTHLDYRPFKCNICNAFFKSKRNAEEHERRHLTPSELNFECDLCGKKFNTNNKMLEHRSRHKEVIKPFQCSKCPKGFQSKYACTAHERLQHKGEYNYKCNFCDKVFIKNSRKKSHEASHTRVGQPFLCNLCPKKYATREGLYKHKKREHILNKPDLKCHKCNLVLKLQSEYAEHCRKHVLEDYQFMCPECGASFVNEIKLKNHLNLIHKFNDKNK